MDDDIPSVPRTDFTAEEEKAMRNRRGLVNQFEEDFGPRARHRAQTDSEVEGIDVVPPPRPTGNQLLHEALTTNPLGLIGQAARKYTGDALFPMERLG